MVMILCFPLMLFAGQKENVLSYDFTLAEGMPGRVVMDIAQQKIVVEIDGGKNVLAQFTEESEDELRDFKTFLPSLHNIVFADYNFDGYTDIAILMEIGNSGVNEFRDYYFYDPVTQKYVLQIAKACNLEIVSKKSRMLEASMKSGLSYDKEIYMINKRGEAFLALRAVGKWPENEEGDMVFTYVSNVKVKVNRAYFYAKPGMKRSKVYVVKGDSVNVLDLMMHKGKMWVKVAYKGKSKTYSGWVKFTDLVFEKLKEER